VSPDRVPAVRAGWIVLHVLNLATAFERLFHARSTVDSSPDSVVGQAEGRLYRFSRLF
jgi:hypothetical protein